MSLPAWNGPGGHVHTLQNGNIITLKHFLPKDRPAHPQATRLKKAGAKSTSYKAYTGELYQWYSQIDQTYCDVIVQFVEKKGSDDDVPGFLAYVRIHGPKTDTGQKHRFQTFKTMSDVRSRAGSYCQYYSSDTYKSCLPLKNLDDDDAKRFLYLNALKLIPAGASGSPSPSIQEENLTSGMIDEVGSIRRGPSRTDTLASSPAAAYPPPTIDPVSNLGHGYFCNNDLAPQYSTGSTASPIGASEVPSTMETSTYQYLESFVTYPAYFGDPQGSGHLFVGRNDYAGHTVNDLSVESGDAYRNSSGGWMNDTWPGSRGDAYGGGSGNYDYGAPGYYRST